MPSVFQQHRTDWVGCTRCELQQGRKQVVLFRGACPCQVLFVGEAPGESEDVVGVPFVGPAGKLLDEIVVHSGIPKVACGFTNLVACIPRDANRKKVTQPPAIAIKACSERLLECVHICLPQLIVWVGQVAQKHGQKLFDESAIPQVGILHPAAIVRMDVSQRGLAIQRCVVALNDAYEEL